MPPRPAFGPRPDYYVGAAYRHGELLRRLCHLDVIAADDPLLSDALEAAHFAVVRADRFMQYREALHAGRPYIVIANDLATMRDPDTEVAEAEREMLELASGIVFVTDPLARHAESRYSLPPWCVIPLKPLACDLDFEPLPQRPHTLAYAGNLLARRALGGPWAYRVNVDIFHMAVKAGWEVHLYESQPSPSAAREYRAAGCIVHEHVPESALLRELSQYTAGLQVFNTRCVPPAAQEYARLAWPNKTWLYQAAGIPTVGCNPGYEAPRIYAGRWGIVLAGPERFASLTEADLPQIDERVRRFEVIDRYLSTFASLLETVTPRPH